MISQTIAQMQVAVTTATKTKRMVKNLQNNSLQELQELNTKIENQDLKIKTLEEQIVAFAKVIANLEERIDTLENN